ncbi:uncharacterized protein LOC126282004 [Schistocerca gregaria]|uniref:uncharacterized protein LOC126282004 n=1 Tax=Schistocerca gregaria TaxID=7010 RepID=UPI00211EC096|nr:uncharacterized protein LOC126282004 [Schistocerca gregaria]
MEAVLDAYFDEVFPRVARDYLLARHRRKQLADYFGHVVAGWCRAGVGDGEGGAGPVSPQLGAARAVRAAVRFHRRTKADNGGSVCRMGKFHNILYVAARMCVDWRVQDTEAVSELLAEIYACERTLERLFAGAVFGPRATHFIAGWKSDFGDGAEGLACTQYFLQHAAAARMHFPDGCGAGRRAADVPMAEYRRSTALAAALQVCKPDVALLLLRHGARFAANLAEEDRPVRGGEMPPRPLVVIPQWGRDGGDAALCFRYALRAAPLALPYPGVARAHPAWSDHVYITCEGGDAAALLAVPPTLKHLSRCAIRLALWRQHRLPDGVFQLPLPGCLLKYVDLAED